MKISTEHRAVSSLSQPQPDSAGRNQLALAGLSHPQQASASLSRPQPASTGLSRPQPAGLSRPQPPSASLSQPQPASTRVLTDVETVGGAQRGPQRVRPLGLHGVFVVKRHVIISSLCPQELPNASLDDANVSTQGESPEEVPGALSQTWHSLAPSRPACHPQGPVFSPHHPVPGHQRPGSIRLGDLCPLPARQERRQT
ncbi:unnamed protein product [Gadus morhua 'NCC']